MRKRMTASQKKIAELKARWARLRGGGNNRKQRTTPHAYAFSKNAAATPKKGEEVDD